MIGQLHATERKTVRVQNMTLDTTDDSDSRHSACIESNDSFIVILKVNLKYHMRTSPGFGHVKRNIRKDDNRNTKMDLRIFMEPVKISESIYDVADFTINIVCIQTFANDKKSTREE